MGGARSRDTGATPAATRRCGSASGQSERRFPAGTPLGRLGWLDYAALVEAEAALVLAEAARLADAAVEVPVKGPPDRLTSAVGVEVASVGPVADLRYANRALGAALALGGDRVVVYRDGRYELEPTIP
jgi:hypothetical protein